MDRDGPGWGPGGGPGHHWGPPGGGHEMFFSLLTMLVVFALLVGIAWVMLRWVRPYLLPRLALLLHSEPAPSALEILRQRYAAGEIDGVTFEQMWERLEASYRPADFGIPAEAIRHPQETWEGRALL